MNTQTHIPPTVTETEAEAIELSLRTDYTYARPEYQGLDCRPLYGVAPNYLYARPYRGR
mgnify:CR=1 FL=1